MRNPKAWVVVRALARCKDCGDEQVAWVQSQRTGKWYLATAYVDGGQFRANKLAPHFTTCTKSLVPKPDPDCIICQNEGPRDNAGQKHEHVYSV